MKYKTFPYSIFEPFSQIVSPPIAKLKSLHFALMSQLLPKK